jgi:hypothetical protein
MGVISTGRWVASGIIPRALNTNDPVRPLSGVPKEGRGVGLGSPGQFIRTDSVGKTPLLALSAAAPGL